MLVATGIGPVCIAPTAVAQILADRVTGAPVPAELAAAAAIVSELRLPRVLLGAIVGAGLALVGGTLQAVTRNPLADPLLFGISSGAALGAAVVLLFVGLPLGPLTLPLGAFLGALTSVALVAGVARHRGGASVLFWMLGGLGRARWELLSVPAMVLGTGFVFLFARARQLNAPLVGDETAATLGVDVVRLRLFLFLVSALVTGTMVALAGAIGFVGLMIPHIMRRLAGADHRRLLPAAALGGRSSSSSSMPVPARSWRPRICPSIVTAGIGGAFFLWQLRCDRA
jgi:iron complex transport system permease protein